MKHILITLILIISASCDSTEQAPCPDLGTDTAVTADVLVDTQPSTDVTFKFVRVGEIVATASQTTREVFLPCCTIMELYPDKLKLGPPCNAYLQRDKTMFLVSCHRNTYVEW